MILQRRSGWSMIDTKDGGGAAWGDCGEGPRGQEVTREGFFSKKKKKGGSKPSPEETDAVAGRLFTPPQATPAFISSGMCLGFQGVSPLQPPASPGGHVLQQGAAWTPLLGSCIPNVCPPQQLRPEAFISRADLVQIPPKRDTGKACYS